MTFPLTAALLIIVAVLAQALAFFVAFRIRRKREMSNEQLEMSNEGEGD